MAGGTERLLYGRAKRRPHFATISAGPAAGSTRLKPPAGRFCVPPSLARPKRVFVNCHYCGYQPAGDVPEDGLCPKCLGHSWERFTLPEPLVPAHMK
jgi:hypothetical protein